MSSRGERLKIARQSLRLTAKDFGQPLDVSKQAVGVWESGKSDLPVATAIAIEALYQVSSRWLLMGEGSMWVDLSKARSKLELPVIIGIPAFAPDGETIDARPDAERQEFSRSAVGSFTREAGNEGTIYMVRAPQAAGFTIHPGDLVVVNAALRLRENPIAPRIYHVLLPGSPEPCFRRCYPAGNNLIVQPDNGAPELVPLPEHRLADIILGWTCTWIHREA